MARTSLSALPLTLGEKQRLAVLLQSVSSHTLLKVLKDMKPLNADARLIVEVLLERAARDGLDAARQDPVIPR